MAPGNRLFLGIGKTLGWTRTSYFLFSGFLAIVFLIVIVWWPLAEEYLSSYNPDIPFWAQMDWLLLGIFFFMSLMIMAGADIKRDWLTLMVGLAGGLVIEAWGTQTLLWSYYTNERPPLWILPAWPIASLTIDRMELLFSRLTRRVPDAITRIGYWIVLCGFYGLMIVFIFHTITKSFTIMALIVCLLLILSTRDQRRGLIIFLAGSALGYFLELWGTTRECWTYYTRETPPVFAVFAHGLAAMAFWRSRTILASILLKMKIDAGHYNKKASDLA